MCNSLGPGLVECPTEMNCTYIPERDLRCILLATLVLAGDCFGATMCAALAVCPAAFGDIGDFVVTRDCVVRLRDMTIGADVRMGG